MKFGDTVNIWTYFGYSLEEWSKMPSGQILYFEARYQAMHSLGCKHAQKVTTAGAEHTHDYSINETNINLTVAGEETMLDNLVRDQMDYLRRRLDNVRQAKKDTAKVTFGLVDEDAPKNFKELQERIASGRYVADEKLEDYNYGPLYAVRWRDPSLKEDSAGYREFKRKLEKLYDRAKDDIRILDVKDGLEALRTFESATVQ